MPGPQTTSKVELLIATMNVLLVCRLDVARLNVKVATCLCTSVEQPRVIGKIEQDYLTPHSAVVRTQVGALLRLQLSRLLAKILAAGNSIELLSLLHSKETKGASGQRTGRVSQRGGRSGTCSLPGPAEGRPQRVEATLLGHALPQRCWLRHDGAGCGTTMCAMYRMTVHQR